MLILNDDLYIFFIVNRIKYKNIVYFINKQTH